MVHTGICALLGYYVASCGNCLPKFWDSVLVPSQGSKVQEEKKAGNHEPQCVRAESEGGDWSSVTTANRVEPPWGGGDERAFRSIGVLGMNRPQGSEIPTSAITWA
jgi:hypothetical protein